MLPTYSWRIDIRARRARAAAVIVLAATGCTTNHPPAHIVRAPVWEVAAVQPMSTVRTTLAHDETCRQVLRTTATGRAIRLHLSNVMSSTPLTLGAVTAGIRSTGAALRAAPARVTVKGSASVTVAPGRAVTTDPIDLAVVPGTDVSVSFAVRGSAQLSEHLVGAATGWCTAPSAGDRTSDPTATAFHRASREGLVVDDVEVLTPAATPRAVLAVGDSLTDPPLPPDTYQRWTDVLGATTHRPVSNVGIGGNRVQLPGGYGRTLIERFRDDVLDRPGADTVVLFTGTNDVSAGIAAPDLIADLTQLCRQAKAARLRVVLVTLAPAWKRAAAMEQVRQEVNSWIRTTTEANAVVDADLLLRDPHDPRRLLPANDWGDGLHVSAAGHRILGTAIAKAIG